jgi:hypothetical protein
MPLLVGIVQFQLSYSLQIGLGDFVPGTNFKGRDGEMNKIKLIINFVYLLGNKKKFSQFLVMLARNHVGFKHFYR